MTYLTGAGAVALLLILILAAGCVSGGCGALPCTTATIPPAAHPAETPAVTDLATLALSRADVPFAVSDERFSGSTFDESNEAFTRLGATRTYQVAYGDGKQGADGSALIQLIMEYPPGNASAFYDYAEGQIDVSAGSWDSFTMLQDPGVGDRSFAFSATTRAGTSGSNRLNGLVFIRENVGEIFMLTTPGSGQEALTPLARKAAALVPAGGTVPPAPAAAAISVNPVPTVTPRAGPQGVVPAGLLVWYDFDDDFVPAGVVRDRSGSGRDATVKGTVESGPGIGGTNGIAFTGNGYILAPDNPAAGHKALTFSFWFRTRDPTQNYKFASSAVWRGGPGTGWTMATHRPEFWADDGPEDLIVPAQPNADNAFVPGEWTHEVVVYDGKTMKEYTNGTLINSWQGRDVPMSKGVPMAVGGWPQFAGYNYAGALDDFRIYDRALPAQEIKTLYLDGRA